MAQSEVVLLFDDVDLIELYGKNDIHIAMFKKAFPDINITSRSNMVKVIGDKKRVQDAKSKLETMSRIVKKFGSIKRDHIKEILSGGNPFANKLVPQATDFIMGEPPPDMQPLPPLLKQQLFRV